jgi:hypothetical protein
MAAGAGKPNQVAELTRFCVSYFLLEFPKLPSLKRRVAEKFSAASARLVPQASRWKNR